MTAANIYLHFDGNCREAMSFYARCLGTDVGFTTYAEVEPGSTAGERIMHSEFRSGPLTLMGSDVALGSLFRGGRNFSISLACESQDEMERLFGALSDGGEITMAMHDAFWGGRFGMLADRFGVSWMLSYRS